MPNETSGFLLMQTRIKTDIQTSVTMITGNTSLPVTNSSEGFEMTSTTAITPLTIIVAAHMSGLAIKAAPPVNATIKHSISAAVQDGISRAFVKGARTENPPKNTRHRGAIAADSTQENTMPLDKNAGTSLIFDLWYTNGAITPAAKADVKLKRKPAE